MSAISPELFKYIQSIEITTNRLVDDVMIGAYQSAFKGNGMRFEEVREFQSGDDVRAIDWNVTARMNTPYVKVFCEERELTVMLLVDVSASSRFGTVNRSKANLIAEIGAVLALSAIKNQDKIGLILFSDQIELYVPANKGTRHVLRIIRELLAFEPKHKGTRIDTCLTLLGKVLPRRSVCFLISDFLDRTDYSHDLKLAGKRHDLNVIEVVDPAEEKFPDIGLIRVRDLETGMLKIVDTSSLSGQKEFEKENTERRNQLRQLFQYAGIGHLKLLTNQAYAPAIRKYFRLKKLRQM